MVRHLIVNKIIHQSLLSAGIPSILEPAHLSKHNGKHPDGLSIIPFSKGKSLMWDFTCPHPLAISHLNSRKVAIKAESIKKDKYKEFNNDYLFIPIAVETLGNYGMSAEIIIKDIGKRIADKRQDQREIFYLRHRIAIGIQKGNAIAFNFALT